jgi:hypothetical protein
MMDCQTKAVRVSSVEMYPDAAVMVFVASDFKAAREEGLKVK